LHFRKCLYASTYKQLAHQPGNAEELDEIVYVRTCVGDLLMPPWVAEYHGGNSKQDNFEVHKYKKPGTLQSRLCNVQVQFVGTHGLDFFCEL
jgi:hypothetical protein